VTKLTILVSTWGDGLFAFTGETRRQEIAKQPVRGLAPDGHGGALVIVGGHVLRRRAPNGEWTTVATSEFELACCMAVGGVIYVGTDDARMLRLSQHAKLEPLESFDIVAGRDTWYAGSAIINGQRVGPPLGIRSVAADSAGTVLFANVHVGGIPRSRDGGKTWQPTIDINSDVHEVRVQQEDPRIIVAAAAIGLCISRDFGETWAVEQEGLYARHCSAVAFSGDDILVSASTDPFASKGRIYRRPIKAKGVLEAVENGLPTWIDGIADTGCIATNGSKIAVADSSGNLYLSADFGHAWSRSYKDLPTPSGVLIC
jgi:BNR/Asp-box repeat